VGAGVMTVLVTGASGFVGRPLCRRLAADGVETVAALRPGTAAPAGVATRPGPSLGPEADWRPALAGVGALVHLAARVHVMHDTAHDPLAEFRAANVAGTLRLAEQAAAAGGRHFVFLSSVKANGEETPAGAPFGPGPGAPVDSYGISKWEAEQGLAALAARTGMAVTILRPPLVYGPGVKGNFRSLLRLVDRRVPLPLGAVDNRRALIGVGNLTDAIARALARPPAAGVCRTYTLCDPETVSTPELIRRLGTALGRPARLLPVPVGLLRLGGRLARRPAMVQRLTASLAVDDRRIRAELGWVPPEGLDHGLEAVATWWRAAGRQG